MGVVAPVRQLRKSEWTVATIDLGQARDLVTRLHYSGGGSNTATFRHGLFRDGDWPLHVSGAAWWIPPTRTAAEATLRDAGLDGRPWQRVLALSRFVLDPDVPKNGASFLLSRSVRLIKQSRRWDVLVTYADEWQGHLGTMYLAAGWEYVGKTKPERVYTLSGRMLARKAGPKTRTHADMLELGAECVGAFARHKFIKILAERGRHSRAYGQGERVTASRSTRATPPPPNPRLIRRMEGGADETPRRRS